MRSEIVIAIYKPHENKEHELKELISKHIPILKTHNLITDRKPILAQSNNGNYIEIFEWKSNDAIGEAHKNPEVQKLWDEMENVCDFTNLESLEEVKYYFPQFKPIN